MTVCEVDKHSYPHYRQMARRIERTLTPRPPANAPTPSSAAASCAHPANRDRAATSCFASCDRSGAPTPPRARSTHRSSPPAPRSLPQPPQDQRETPNRCHHAAHMQDSLQLQGILQKSPTTPERLPARRPTPRPTPPMRPTPRYSTAAHTAPNHDQSRPPRGSSARCAKKCLLSSTLTHGWGWRSLSGCAGVGRAGLPPSRAQ